MCDIWFYFSTTKITSKGKEKAFFILKSFSCVEAMAAVGCGVFKINQAENDTVSLLGF